MYISIHIPKTAGTSLAAIFDYGSGRRIMYDYKEYKLYDPAYEDDREDIFEHKSFITRNFDFIHGHFPYVKYSDIFPSSCFMACVRRPIDRLISQYFHIIDKADINDWLYKSIIAGIVDLADFAAMDDIGDVQSSLLSGRNIEDYDHVFINEKLAESVYQFQLLHNFSRNDPWMNNVGEASIPRLNIGGDKGKNKPEISKQEMLKAQCCMEEDNELYAKAMEKFSVQAKKSSGLIV
ncbi:sulfotransferase family 2 domain-containing protein [Candidatus Pacearchaeota archaeon]|nr:sulfotransferase family 2 domain-containing protein [Candidatus Pacearchaeota archaeon]